MSTQPRGAVIQSNGDFDVDVDDVSETNDGDDVPETANGGDDETNDGDDDEDDYDENDVFDYEDDEEVEEVSSPQPSPERRQSPPQGTLRRASLFY